MSSNLLSPRPLAGERVMRSNLLSPRPLAGEGPGVRGSSTSGSADLALPVCGSSSFPWDKPQTPTSGSALPAPGDSSRDGLEIQPYN